MMMMMMMGKTMAMMMRTISKHPGRPEPRTIPHHRGAGGTESRFKPRTTAHLRGGGTPSRPKSRTTPHRRGGGGGRGTNHSGGEGDGAKGFVGVPH